jgi:aminoglycoside 6'-N-acetyltransferase I
VTILLTDQWLSGCVDLYVKTFNAPPWNEDWSPADALQRLGDFLASPRSAGVCVTDLDGEVIGFALGHRERYSDGDHFLLQELCVRQDLQRQGHGTELLQGLGEVLPGVSRWYLLTAHASEAASFYQKNGFRPAKQVGVFVRP